MATSPTKDTPGDLFIKVFADGTEVKAPLIQSAEVQTRVNRIPRARIVALGPQPRKINDPGGVADSVFKPGALIRIEAGYALAATVPIFSGVVLKYGMRIGADNKVLLEIECRDRAVAMTLGRKSANYVKQKDSAIFATLASNHGLTAEAEATGTEYPELVQFNVSDWDFLLARAELNGMVVLAEGGKLTVKPPATSAAEVLTVTYGKDLMDFRAEIDAGTQLTAVDSYGWDPATQAMVTASAPAPTLNTHGDLAGSDLAAVLNLASYRLQSTLPMDAQQLQTWAAGQQVKAVLSRLRGSITFQGHAAAKAGVMIELAKVGPRFNGKAYIGAVTHRLLNNQWRTEAEFGLPADSFSSGTALAAPLAAGMTAGVHGLQVGVVLQLDQDPEAMYKVKVSLPTMKASTDGVWARLAGLYASDGCGAFFLPEVGDEVVLGFFDSDPSHPVLLGSLYSSKRKPPYEFDAANNTKAIVTRTRMKLEFNEDKKIITITTPGLNKIVIDDDAKSILLQDQHGNQIEMNQAGIALDSPKDIRLTAKGKITLDAVGNIGLTSKADIKGAALNIEHAANVALSAKGGASAELSASGTTTVKGAMVLIN